MNYHEIIRIYGGDPRKTRQNVRCPAHADHNPSLSIGLDETGEKILLHCHAGCSKEAVLTAKGLTLSDLYNNYNPYTLNTPAARYDYYDSNGNVIATKVRFVPKDFRWEYPDKRKPQTLPLYNQYHTLVMKSNIIYIVEGEKDVDTLTAAGLPAVSSPHGATKSLKTKKWLFEYTQFLSKKHVVLIPDHDEIGNEYAKAIADELYGKSLSVKIIHLEEIWKSIPSGADVTDYLQNGGTTEQLLELAERTATYSKNSDKCNLKTISALELYHTDFPPPQFIVQDFLTVGLSILTAPPKFGKSWMVLDLCLSVSAGQPFMSHDTNECSVLYYALEDSENRLKTRMNQLLDNKPPNNKFNFVIECKTLGQGFEEELDSFLKNNPDTKLIVIDTFQIIRGSHTRSSNAYAADYEDMNKLNKIAKSKDIAILLVHHNRKMKDTSDPFNEISGTNGIMGGADTIFTITKDKRNSPTATLNIESRDFESSCELIEFDKAVHKWKRIGSKEDYEANHQREDFESNGIVQTIRHMIANSANGEWLAKSGDIYNVGLTVNPFYFRIHRLNSCRIVKALPNLIPLLEKYCCIKTTKIAPNGNGSKTYLFHEQRYPIAPIEHIDSIASGSASEAGIQ